MNCTKHELYLNKAIFKAALPRGKNTRDSEVKTAGSQVQYTYTEPTVSPLVPQKVLPGKIIYTAAKETQTSTYTNQVCILCIYEKTNTDEQIVKKKLQGFK